MTDKEILEAVKAEIERLHEEHRGSKGDWYYRLALRSILHFIKTLQVEPTNPSVDEAMAEIERKAKLFTEVNKGKTSEEILAEMRCEEPVSEDLREAARKYFKSLKDDCFISSDIMLAFKAGANWQKQQMMKQAISSQCFGRNLQGEALFSFPIKSDKYLVGSEVKLIIIKED